MPRKVKDRALDTREGRSRLKARGMPYYRSLDRRLHLGYRRLKGKAGTWWARHYVGGAEYELESIGAADDLTEANGIDILDYWQAQDEARKRMQKRVQSSAEADGTIVTVGTALDRYKKDLQVRGRNVDNVARVRAHMPEDGELSKTPVGLLTSKRLQDWRDGLLEEMTAESVDRVCNALRAALNRAADHSEGRQSRAAWETGLKSISQGGEPRNVVVADRDILRILSEAPKENEEFSLFVEVAAATGARPSQIARVLVRDLKSDQIEMPSSRKGGAKKKYPSQPIPITPSLAARLRKSAEGKGQAARLLTKPSGEPWKKSDHNRPFERTVKRAELDPDVITIYALRHSSITRQLKANIPIRIVAALHDTSVVMIERTYSANIAKFANDIVRPHLLETAPAINPASNVTSIAEARR
jgi:integrase